MKNNLMINYNKALQDIYDHVGFVEDLIIYPIDDATDYYWDIDVNTVKYAENIEKFNSDGDYYLDEVYTQRFYKKHIYEGEDLTLVFCDTQTDNMKYFRIFHNSKRMNVKEKREKTLKKVLHEEEAQDK